MSYRFKFRVWDNRENWYIQFRASNDKEPFTYILGDADGSGNTIDSVFNSGWHNPDDCVIEQCTGLKDQSGKLIFEGDIVDQYSPMEDCRRRCVVEWVSEAGGGYICKYLDGKGNPCAHGNSEGTYFDGAWCVVVGNIHDGTSNAET